MPSVGEIFTVSGVAVGSGVDVACGVDVAGICVVVGATVGARVAVDGKGVAALWHATSTKIEIRKSIIFFIVSLFVGQACSLTVFENWFWRVKNPPYLKPLLNQQHCISCLVFIKIWIDLISLLPGFECAFIIAFAVQPKAIP